jgi:hypothetical protein
LTHLLRALGVILVLGGLAHSAGVIHLYATQGVPDANRVLLDIWIAQAQLLSGSLYLVAWRARRVGSTWRALAMFGALTMIGFAVPVLPVLIVRAPLIFRIPAIGYLLASLIILTAASAQSLRRTAR